GTDRVAVFSFCGIFSMADDYYTGNLVPYGQKVPEGVPAERLYANYRCNYAYAFDTTNDKTFFHLQNMLEDYMCTVKDFNPTNLKRRDYQSGQDPNFTKRYWMRTPMFIRMNKGEPKPRTPSYIHEWVVEAERRATVYHANPARPAVLALEDGVVRDIRKCEPDSLTRGDVVVVTFTVSFVVAAASWFPQLLPIEFVRVGNAPVVDATDAAEYAIPVVDMRMRPILQDGESMDG
ncbi:hypothetical protein C8Q73DRAFT_620348, partial [Cubamyces lactineus]